MNDSIGARIALLIESMSIKKVRFAERIEVDQSYVTQLTSNKRKPSDRLISSICREFNVNAEWLRTGNGSMFVKTEDSVLGQLTTELGLDKFLQSIVREYLKLSPEQRAIVRDFIYSVTADSPNESISPE